MTPCAEQADLEQALRGTLALEPNGAPLVAPGGISRSHGSGGTACTACSLVRIVRAASMPGYSTILATPSCRASGRRTRRVRRDGISRPPADAFARSPCICFIWFASFWTAAASFAGWMSFGGLLADPAFESFAKDGPKTWRKLNAVMCLATQSPSDVLDSPISRTLVEQTPTKVFFPNADANLARLHAMDFGLTSASSDSSRINSSQGRACFWSSKRITASCAELDLKGFDAELAVISGRAAEVKRMQQIVSESGADPNGLAAEIHDRK